MTELEALSALRGDDLVQAVRAEAALWAMWHRSGDPRLDSLLREGIEAIERQDLPTAAAVFTRLSEEARTLAEGWNKRATVRYLAKDYSGAIADCRETLAPRNGSGCARASRGSRRSRLSSPLPGIGRWRACSNPRQTSAPPRSAA